MAELLVVILWALAGGVSLGINRSLLGTLGMSIGPAGASVVNHIGGAIFIFIVILCSSAGTTINLTLLKAAPIFAYCGGIIGALFVAIASWVIPRAGVMKATILLVSGQMLMGTVIDLILGRVHSIPSALGGLSLIIAGVVFGEYRKMLRRRS